MGFKNDIEKIMAAVKNASGQKTQNLLFSATMPAWIWEITKTYLNENHLYIDLIKDEVIRTSKTI